MSPAPPTKWMLLTRRALRIIFRTTSSPSAGNWAYTPIRNSHLLSNLIVLILCLFRNESDDQVRGVPDAHRLKKSTRVEALAHYRHRYLQQAVKKRQPETFTTGVSVPGV